MAFSKQTTLKRQLTRISPLSATMILLFAAVMTYLIFRVFAATGPATLYTSPTGSQSITNGQSFTVSVRISSAANVPISCASVYLSYPTDKLQITGIGYNGSAYSVQALESNSGGVLHMDRCGLPVISGGDQLYAQVSFKAIATGSAALGFTGSSTVLSGEGSSNANLLGQTNGVTYNIAAPATPPPSSGGGSSGSSGGSGSTSGSSGSSSSSSGSHSGSSSGGSGSTGSSGGSSSGGGSDSGSSGSSGNPGSGSTGDNGGSGGVTTTTIAITVLDSHNKPVAGAEVVINGQTVKTGKNGVAYFSGVPSGNQAITIKYNGKKTSRTLQIRNAASVQSPQSFKVSITRNKFDPVLLLIPFIILAGAGIFFVRPWDKRLAQAFGQEETLPVVSSSDNPATVQPTTPVGRKLEQPGTVYAPTNKDQPPKE